MINKKPFIKWAFPGIELPLHQNLIYWLSPTAALEQSLRALWDAASWAAVLILPQIKFNSQLSSCTSVFSQQWDSPGRNTGAQSSWHPNKRLLTVNFKHTICVTGRWEWSDWKNVVVRTEPHHPSKDGEWFTDWFFFSPWTLAPFRS